MLPGAFLEVPGSRQSKKDRAGSLTLGGKQLSDEGAKLRRLSMKSRGTLDRKEKKIQGQMKELMKEWKEIQQIKDSIEIKEGSAAEDEWDSPRPGAKPNLK